jgi:hypothetical protein
MAKIERGKDDSGGEKRDPSVDSDSASVQNRLEYLRDEELDEIDEDEFNHVAYVDLLERVVHYNGPEWHIGLFGTWGSGKSSVTKLLNERIRKGRKDSVSSSRVTEASNQGTFTSTDSNQSRKDEDTENHESLNTSTDSGDSTEDQAEVDNEEKQVTQEDSYENHSQSDRHSEQPAVTVDDGGPTNNPNFNFGTTACARVNAWKHDLDSIRTGILLDLNEALAGDVIEEDYIPKSRMRRHERWFWKVRSWISKTRPPWDRDELLSSGQIINTLHDIEEESEETPGSYWNAIKSFAIRNVPLLAFVLAIGGIVYYLFGIGTVETFLALGAAGIVFQMLLRDVRASWLETNRTLKNPREDWAGSYEELFNEIIDEAKNESTRNAEFEGELTHIVITIDDLDRCESRTVYRTLIALKSFFGHPQCTYIVPCDEEALYRHIQAADEGEYLEDESNKRDFLAKFFETQIRIAPATESSLREFALKQLEDLSVEVEESVIQDVIMPANFRTPRRIKQLINRTATLRELAREREVCEIYR